MPDHNKRERARSRRLTPLVYQVYGNGMKSAAATAPIEDASPYDRLKMLILGGHIPWGEPLVERSIAERLGVSRTPVRETLVRLEREGLVRIVEGKGAFVASFTLEDMIE